MEYILATAASGRPVRIPADKFEEWQREQEEIRNGKKPQMSPETENELKKLFGI